MSFHVFERFEVLISFSSLTNRLMVRVINYFDTQVRVPTSDRAAVEGAASRRRALDKDVANAKSAFEEHMTGPGARAMSDEHKVSWYGKILDSVRLRYRKLQRFARCVKLPTVLEYPLISVFIEFALIDSAIPLSIA